MKHVHFELTSDDNNFKKFKRNESKVPFALFGDKKGNYSPGTLPIGDYDLKAEAHGHKGKKGKKGKKDKMTNIIAFSIDLIDPMGGMIVARSVKVVDETSSEELKKLSDQLLNATDFIVFPNPSVGTVNFIWNAGQEGKVELSIFDSAGRIVEVFESDGAFEHAIDFSKYKVGIYISRIITPNYTEVQRFIID